MHEGQGGLATRLPFYNSIAQQLQVNILTIAHRGYHESDGHAHEEGIKKDADAIIDYIKEAGDIDEKEALNDNQKALKMINPDMIYLFGKGTGGAVAMYMA